MVNPGEREFDLNYIRSNLGGIKSREELRQRKEILAVVCALESFNRGVYWVRPYNVRTGASQSVVRIAMRCMTQGGLLVSQPYADKHDAIGRVGNLTSPGTEYQITDEGKKARAYVLGRVRKFSD